MQISSAAHPIDELYFNLFTYSYLKFLIETSGHAHKHVSLASGKKGFSTSLLTRRSASPALCTRSDISVTIIHSGETKGKSHRTKKPPKKQ